METDHIYEIQSLEFTVPHWLALKDAERGHFESEDEMIGLYAKQITGDSRDDDQVDSYMEIYKDIFIDEFVRTKDSITREGKICTVWKGYASQTHHTIWCTFYEFDDDGGSGYDVLTLHHYVCEDLSVMDELHREVLSGIIQWN